MNRTSPFLSTMLLGTAMLCAAPARSQESGLVQLQHQMSKRAMVNQVTPALMRDINDSNKAVAGNIGRSGAGKSAVEVRGAVRRPGPASGSASASAQTREAIPPARSLPEPRTPPKQPLSALNPQPLPPVERGRRGAPR